MFMKSRILSNMKILAKLFFLVFTSFITSLSGCSSAKEDYEQVQKLQVATEELLKNTFDFDVILQSCDNVVSSLQSYLEKHKEEEWSNLAKIALDSWKARRTAYENEFNSLHEKIAKALEEKATQASKEHHSFSNFEEFKLEKREKNKQGAILEFHDIYDVRMRGALFGKNVFKFKVHVFGSIAMDKREIEVKENTGIEE